MTPDDLRTPARPIGLGIALGLVLVAAPGCSEGGDVAGAPPGYGTMGDEGKPPPEPLPPGSEPEVTGPLPNWVDVTAASGIDCKNHSGKPAQKDWIVSAMGGSSVVTDYDNDGDMDLLVVDGTMLTAAGELEYSDEMRTRLFRNDGGLKFAEVTREAGIDVRAFAIGGASCDYDGDGHDDVYICAWGRNYLLRNKGDGTFEDVTAAAGVLGDEADMSTSCAWGDVDGDGVHDLYVSNYVDQRKQIREFQSEGKPGRSCKWRGFAAYCGPPGLTGQPDRLYLGNGDGTFREVTETHLREQRNHYAFQPIMTDVDNDGDLDIYVANDTQRNTLWVNEGKGMFIDRGLEAGVAVDTDVKEQAGMGVDAADVNRDGLMDLFVTNFSHDYNTLYINQTRRADGPLFSDRSHAHNIARLSYLRLCWGTRLFDMDNDGDLDMFVACGHVYGEIDNFAAATGTSYRQQNLLLANLGPPAFRFADVTEKSGPAFQIKRVWRGAVFADFDNDGDQDVFVSGLNEEPALFRNDGGNENAFLVFSLSGTGGQRDPSGARVTVHTPGGMKLMEERHNGASFCSDNDPRLFFGLGSVETAPRVDVLWPDGSTQTFENVPTRKHYRIEQGRDELLQR